MQQVAAGCVKYGDYPPTAPVLNSTGFLLADTVNFLLRDTDIKEGHQQKKKPRYYVQVKTYTISKQVKYYFKWSAKEVAKTK